jgi:hypothetical protein
VSSKWPDVVVKVLEWFRSAYHIMITLLIASLLACIVSFLWPQTGLEHFRGWAFVVLFISGSYISTYPFFDPWRKKVSHLRQLTQNEKAALRLFVNNDQSVAQMIASSNEGLGATSLMDSGILLPAKQQMDLYGKRGLLYCQIPNEVLQYLRKNYGLLS